MQKCGHIKRKCHTKNAYQGEVEEQETFGLYGIKTVTKAKSSAYMVSVKVNGHPNDMLVDTGPVVSIAPEYIYRKHLTQLPLKETRGLKSYSGGKLDLLGELTVTVEYHAHKCELSLLVIMKGNKPALFGRNWLEIIKLDWGKILSISKDNAIDRLEKEYSNSLM